MKGTSSQEALDSCRNQATSGSTHCGKAPRGRPVLENPFRARMDDAWAPESACLKFIDLARYATRRQLSPNEQTAWRISCKAIADLAGWKTTESPD